MQSRLASKPAVTVRCTRCFVSLGLAIYPTHLLIDHDLRIGEARVELVRVAERKREIEASAAAMFRDDVRGTWMSGTDWGRLDGSLREAYVDAAEESLLRPRPRPLRSTDH